MSFALLTQRILCSQGSFPTSLSTVALVSEPKIDCQVVPITIKVMVVPFGGALRLLKDFLVRLTRMMKVFAQKLVGCHLLRVVLYLMLDPRYRQLVIKFSEVADMRILKVIIVLIWFSAKSIIFTRSPKSSKKWMTWSKTWRSSTNLRLTINWSRHLAITLWSQGYWELQIWL